MRLPLLRYALQRQLFPAWQEELGPLGNKDRLFVEVLARLPDQVGLQRYGWRRNGRPPASRRWLFRCFVAKAVYGFATTAALIEALRSRPTSPLLSPPATAYSACEFDGIQHRWLGAKPALGARSKCLCLTTQPLLP